MPNTLTLDTRLQYGLVLYPIESKPIDGMGWGVHGYLYPIIETKKTHFKKNTADFSQYGYVKWPTLNQTFPTGNRAEGQSHVPELAGNIDGYVKKSQPVTPLYFFDFYGPNPEGNDHIGLEKALALINETSNIVQAMVIIFPEYYCAFVDNPVKRDGDKKLPDLSSKASTIIKSISEKNTRLILGCPPQRPTTDQGEVRAREMLARGVIAAMEGYPEKQTITPAAIYRKKTRSSSRLLEQRWWYGINNEPTNTYPGFSGKHVYFLGNHGKANTEEDLIGKYTATAKIAVLVRSQPEPVLEMLHSHLRSRYYEEVGRVTLGYLEHITQVDRYNVLLHEGKSVLWARKKTRSFCTPDGTILMKELTPAYHGFKLMSKLYDQLALVKSFLEKNEKLAITDVTQKLFNKVTKKGKSVYATTPQIDPPHRTVTLDIRHHCQGGGTKSVVFKMGQDIPLRNTLNAVMGDNCRVYAITWVRSKNEFYYATITQVDEDLLLTCSLASNVVVVV